MPKMFQTKYFSYERTVFLNKIPRSRILCVPNTYKNKYREKKKKKMYDSEFEQQ